MVKNSPANAGDVRDTGSIPGSGRSPGESIDRRVWQATVHGVTKIWTQLNYWACMQAASQNLGNKTLGNPRLGQNKMGERIAKQSHQIMIHRDENWPWIAVGMIGEIQQLKRSPSHHQISGVGQVLNFKHSLDGKELRWKTWTYSTDQSGLTQGPDHQIKDINGCRCGSVLERR